MDASNPEIVSQRVLRLSAGLALLLVLAIGAFIALRGRTAPLWLSRHGTVQSTTQ